MHPFQKHSETSKAAAEAAISSAGVLRERVHEYLLGMGTRGAIDEDIQISLDMNPNTQRPRRIELVEDGRVVDSGLRQKTKANRDAVIWLAVEHAGEDAVKKIKTLDGKLKALKFKSYEEYLNSMRWKSFRAAYYMRHGRICAITSETANIELHHISYDNLGSEEDSDVIAVTSRCHRLIHHLVKERGVPLKESHLVINNVIAEIISW